MKTIKQFAKASHINEQLIRAVIRQMGGFDSFKQSAHDVANYGANGGFSGFIYYTDTNTFFKRNKAAILECANELALWDRITPQLPGSAGFAKAGDYYTLANGVCLAKEAARQWKEQQEWSI